MTERVSGVAAPFDVVAYEDRANPREVYTVKLYDGGEYQVEDAEGNTHWSDLRQHGWTVVERASEARCESGWSGDRCTYTLGHFGPHSNE